MLPKVADMNTRRLLAYMVQSVDNNNQ